MFISKWQFNRAIAEIHAHIHRLETKIMGVLDDAVASLADAITGLDAAVQAEIAVIKAAQSDTQIQTAAANIGKLTAAVAADTKALTDSIAPTPLPPAPSPVSTPST